MVYMVCYSNLVWTFKVLSGVPQHQEGHKVGAMPEPLQEAEEIHQGTHISGDGHQAGYYGLKCNMANEKEVKQASACWLQEVTELISYRTDT